MKKIYCLLLVPAFMLPSCGAKKISDEKALEIINAVHDKYMTLQDTAEAYEATLHLKQRGQCRKPACRRQPALHSGPMHNLQSFPAGGHRRRP